MQTEQLVKGTSSFLSILTKKYQILTVFSISVTLSTGWLMITEGSFENLYKMLSLAGIGVVGFVLTLIFAHIGELKEEEILRKRVEFATEQTIKIEEHKEAKKLLDKQDAEIKSARMKIDNWIDNPPDSNRKRLHHFDYGVKAEYKVTPTGICWAILYIEGKEPERTRIYR